MEKAAVEEVAVVEVEAVVEVKAVVEADAEAIRSWKALSRNGVSLWNSNVLNPCASCAVSCCAMPLAPSPMLLPLPPPLLPLPLPPPPPVATLHSDRLL